MPAAIPSTDCGLVRTGMFVRRMRSKHRGGKKR